MTIMASARRSAPAVLALSVLLLVAARPAAAQDLPPSLTIDTSFALTGVSEYDFRPVVSRDEARAAAADATLGRSYAVGATQTAAGDTDIAVVARRADGALDTTFAGDGTLALSVTAGQDDAAVAVAVLPDHSLRILGTTDTGADSDVALVGLLPDGTPDPHFGTAGIVTFSAGGTADAPAALAVEDGSGRLAITGGTNGATSQDTFVTVRAADGSPDATFGTTVLDRGGATIGDRGVGVAWRPAGPVALIAIDRLLGAGTALEAFTADGHTDAAFASVEPAFTGASDVAPGALLAYGGRLWFAGTVTTSGDSDAYLARVDADGTNLATRRFDMRGTVFPASQPVDSEGLSLTLVPGDPDTLVLGGATATDRGREWSFAAFNGLGGALTALGASDIVIPIDGQGGADAVAGTAGGAVSAAGTLTDFSVESGGTMDHTIGMARVLVDAEKRCDLALAILSPVELVLRGHNVGSLTFRVTNNGTRPCSGEVSVPAPYVMSAGAGPTGRLSAGQSVTRTVDIAYGAPLEPDGTLVMTLASAADAQPGDNVARLRVSFAFCDLALRIADQPDVLGTEGGRRYAFTLRNLGTAPCRAAQVVAAAPGRRLVAAVPYPVGAGRSVTDEFDVGVLRGTPTGLRAPLAFRAFDADDVSAPNNTATATPIVVRPGDTNARTPSRGKIFRGSARPGSAKNVRKRTLQVKRVEIAVLRSGDSCRWLSSVAGDLQTVDANAAGKCDEPVWVPARGTKTWRIALQRKLPKGRYTLMTRAVLVNGVSEGRFSASDHNLVRFRLR
jgi:hypothetical protein